MLVALGLGANIGDAMANIRHAVESLEAVGLKSPLLSRFYETLPVDCVPGTPNFINAAVVGQWTRPLAQILPACKEIEERLGRPREHSSNEARVIDMDIILAECGSLTLPGPGLRIPHPQVYKRLFVLMPLCDIVPQWLIPPENLTVCEATQRRLAEVGSPPPVWLAPDQPHRQRQEKADPEVG